MKKLQVARFLLITIFIGVFLELNASTQNTNNYTLQLSGANQNIDQYYTGIISNGVSGTAADRPVLIQTGTNKIHLANSGNTFSNGIAIVGNASAADLVCIGYPPGGFTTAVTASGNSYMGSGRTIRFSTRAGGLSTNGGVLELGCDMSAANIAFQARTTAGAIIRGYNQTSAYTIRLSSYVAGIQAAGPISIGAGATVVLGFTLPVGSGTTHYSAFNMSGTSTNAGTLRLFNGASSSTAAINVNAYGILDCSLCTTQRANALSTGTLTVAANGKIIFPSTSGTWTKPIA